MVAGAYKPGTEEKKWLDLIAAAGIISAADIKFRISGTNPFSINPRWLIHPAWNDNASNVVCIREAAVSGLARVYSLDQLCTGRITNNPFSAAQSSGPTRQSAQLISLLVFAGLPIHPNVALHPVTHCIYTPYMTFAMPKPLIRTRAREY